MQPWGDAYLPVYMAYFGLCFLLAVAMEKMYHWLTRVRTDGEWAVPTAGVFWLLLLSLNFRNNWLVARAMNEAVWSPRVLVEEALARGLLTGVAPSGVLLVNGNEPWDNAAEYVGQTGIRFPVYQMNQTRDLTPIFQTAGGLCAPVMNQQVCDFAPDIPVYTIQIRHLTAGTGAVLLARVQRAYQANGAIQGLVTNDVTTFFRFPDSAQRLTAAVSGRSVLQKSGSNAFRLSRELQTIKEGREWKLVSLRGATAFDALSLRGEITAEGKVSAISVPKSREAFELHTAGAELLHTGYQSGDLGNGAEFPSINFESEMSIEVLVVPGDSQGANAEIISNHWSDSTGLAIEGVNAPANQYAAVFGTGKGWMQIGNFALLSGRRNYISLQVKDREARLYVNGDAVSKKVLPEAIAQSRHPVLIGNWKGHDRSFNGWIEEVLISKNTKPEETILKDTRRLLGESRKLLLLNGIGPSLLHKSLDPQGAQFLALPNTLQLPESFTLELIVHPANTQVQYATIISNHPGKGGFQGFTVEQVDKRTNYYSLAFGNGKAWMPVGEFSISPGSTHYLAITKDKRQVSLYLDGRRVAEKALAADLSASDYPLTIGNWVMRNRPFNGVIQEVRIKPGVASAKSIADEAGALQRASSH